MTSVPQTSRGGSLRQPSTTPDNSFSQKSQHLKISAKKAINNEFSIPEGMNIKERIGKLGLMWPRTYITRHHEKSLLQSFSTEGCPFNCDPEFSTDKIEASIFHVPHMSVNYIEDITSLRLEVHTKVQNRFSKILKYKTTKDIIPPTLEVSPSACVSH